MRLCCCATHLNNDATLKRGPILARLCESAHQQSGANITRCHVYEETSCCHSLPYSFFSGDFHLYHIPLLLSDSKYLRTMGKHSEKSKTSYLFALESERQKGSRIVGNVQFSCCFHQSQGSVRG